MEMKHFQNTANIFCTESSHLYYNWFKYPFPSRQTLIFRKLI